MIAGAQMSGCPAWGRRRLASTVGWVLLGLLLTGGCMRARVAVAVGADDRVTGEVVIAVVVQSEQEAGAVLTPPPELAAKVRTEPYRQDGYAGTRLLFTGLTFEEFGRLNDAGGGAPQRLHFELRRSGNLVLFNGRVDLTTLPAPERADVEIRMSFPGRLTATNGDQDDETVTWTTPAGRVSELSATARYAEPGSRTWLQWALVVGGLAGLVVLVTAVLAFIAHRRFVRQSS